MIETYVEWFRAVGAYLGVLSESALPTMGALVAIAVVVAVLSLVARAAVAVVVRMSAVGSRARRHAVLLAVLPDAAHPDADGHARPRAPGSLLPIA